MLTRLSNDEPACWSAGKIVVEYAPATCSDRSSVRDRARGDPFVKQYRYTAERDPQLRSETTESVRPSRTAGSRPSQICASAV